MATCINATIALAVNYTTLSIPFLLILTVVIHLSRSTVFENYINKPSYQLMTAYGFNFVYIVTFTVTLFIIALFILGPYMFPEGYASCVSPLA